MRPLGCHNANLAGILKWNPEPGPETGQKISKLGTRPGKFSYPETGPEPLVISNIFDARLLLLKHSKHFLLFLYIVYDISPAAPR